ncbi:MAG: hypothetical protein KGM17_00375 [Sphingomonadales bacterium]|nr:hypothetical protein [Sphingomonadales bacterium]
MIRYFVYDAEYERDAAGHALYQAAEGFDPEGIERLRDRDPRIDMRWVFKRPVAISWLVLEEEGGKLVPGTLHSLGRPELTEQELLTSFFAAVGELPREVPLVTWGGSSSDEPQLRLAGLRHGLRVPARLMAPFQPGKRFGSGHVDLMTHLCGDAARVHLAEICAALRIPAKTVAPPDATARLIAQGKWSLVKAICENDTLSTTALLVHAVAPNYCAGSLSGTLLGLARAGARQAHRPYAQTFEAWAADLVRQMSLQVLVDLAAFA